MKNKFTIKGWFHSNMNKSKYEMTTEFHKAFNRPIAESPEALSSDQSINRMSWTAEEIIEFLHSTTENDQEFDELYCQLIDNMESTYQKQMHKERHQNKLIGQSDALIDMLYFIFGSFTEIGINPDPIFNIVHAANMAKIWSDGKAHYNEAGKVIKPPEWVAPESLIEAEVLRQIRESI